MATIRIKKGINLPFKENYNNKDVKKILTKKVCLDFSKFTYLHLRLLKKVGDNILKGENLMVDNHMDKRTYLSPVSGKIVEILRGERRRITGVIIEINDKPGQNLPPYDLTKNVPKENVMDYIFSQGLSFHIHKRPFHRVINDQQLPRSIFITTVSSSPYSPSFNYIMKGNEKIFQSGLDLLSKFSPVHLVYNDDLFIQFTNCEPHKILGPHPIESPSIHIMAIDPIKDVNDVVWSLDVYDVLSIGSVALNGEVFDRQIFSCDGDGFENGEKILIESTKGADLKELFPKHKNLISGNPLSGTLNHGYLKEKDYSVISLKFSENIEIMPFIKPGFNKYSMTKTFLSKLISKKNNNNLQYTLGGEGRPFIAKDIYQDFFPFNIYIEPLIKALLSEDYSLAISIGFLDIDTIDLAIPEYLCPSKIPLMSIFEKAKVSYLLLNE